MAHPSPSTVRTVALELARASRGPNPDPNVLVEKRQRLAEAKLANYISQVVASAPPLTDEQRDKLALLLRPGAS